MIPLGVTQGFPVGNILEIPLWISLEILKKITQGIYPGTPGASSKNTYGIP